jgi:hypothetical protein
MNCKGCGRKRSWPNLGYYPGIYLQGQRKITKTIVRIAGIQVEILNMTLPKTKQEWSTFGD